MGVVGLEGFVGKPSGSHLPDFGEALLRRCTPGPSPTSRRSTSDVAVYHVSVPVLRRAFCVSVLAGIEPVASTLH